MLPGMEIFPQIRGIHSGDGEFQFGLEEFWLLNQNFQINKFMEMGNFGGFFEF